MERLIDMCKAIWSMLSESEQEDYAYDTGLYGFIEDVATLIHFGVNTLTEDDMDRILDEIG